MQIFKNPFLYDQTFFDAERIQKAMQESGSIRPIYRISSLELNHNDLDKGKGSKFSGKTKSGVSRKYRREVDSETRNEFLNNDLYTKLTDPLGEFNDGKTCFC